MRKKYWQPLQFSCFTLLRALVRKKNTIRVNARRALPIFKLLSQSFEKMSSSDAMAEVRLASIFVFCKLFFLPKITSAATVTPSAT
jgi:hypothetical protein